MAGKALDKITRPVIDGFVYERRLDGVSNATVNRSLALLRAVLNTAATEWQWLESPPKIKLLKEPKQRVRYLDDNQITRLLGELPEHLNLIVRFALATGLRESNIVNLEWPSVNIGRRVAVVSADDTKTGKALGIPLNSDAMDVIFRCQEIRSEYGRSVSHVFTYLGNPVSRANNHAWRKALKRAGIDDFRFHDLRHTWATRHINAGTPVDVLKQLGGWSSVDMVLKYAHHAGDRLSEYAGNISGICTKPVHIKKGSPN
jgi:integrase